MKIRVINKIKCVLLSVMIFICGVLSACGDNNSGVERLGVWWWSDSLGDEYLQFAKDNGVTEIYYCSGKFNEKTDGFIKKASELNIDVYWLAGEYQWVEDITACKKQIDRYVEYQKKYGNKFCGIHFDIEPHQHPKFKEQRKELITKLVLLVKALKESYPDIFIEYDLPFWLEDDITINGLTKPAFAHVIDYASRVTLMSYRDTAEEIYRVSEAEIEYAKQVGKKLNLGVETYSTEGDKVSFYEEGKAVMNKELESLKQMLPSGFGIVIHQIKHWYDLKD